MTIFACVNTKGGVGKTTTAVHLATLLAIRGNTLLIDGDPQGSAASWAAWRRDNVEYSPSPTTVCLQGKAINTEGRHLASSYDHVVVDAGGRDSVGLRSALLLAEVVIVPVGASSFDAAAMTDLLTVVDLARDYNPNLDVRMLLSRVDTRTKDTGEMLAFLEEQSFSVFKTKICERVAFRRCISEGAIVHELKRDHAAIQEMNAFVAEVLG